MTKSKYENRPISEEDAGKIMRTLKFRKEKTNVMPYSMDVVCVFRRNGLRSVETEVNICCETGKYRFIAYNVKSESVSVVISTGWLGSIWFKKQFLSELKLFEDMCKRAGGMIDG